MGWRITRGYIGGRSTTWTPSGPRSGASAGWWPTSGRDGSPGTTSSSASSARRRQIRPKLLICADGYRYAGKAVDSLERSREVRTQIPEIERVIVVPYLHHAPDISGIPGAIRWDQLLAAYRGAERPSYVRLPFDHPLYIMYSSGTTGLPKCMVHGAGGTLLQHLKELVLHTDLGS